jgi:excisionase family DNA binding protein
MKGKRNVEKKWITPREVAQELGMSVRTVYDLIHSGRLRAKERGA